MIDAYAIIDATWPAAEYRRAGGFLIRDGQGGGSRVSCATLEVPLEQADIPAAEAAHRALGQRPRFMIRAGDEALDAVLEARGYEAYDPVRIWSAPIAAMQGEVPPVTAFAHWPPLQIARDLWTELDVGPERQAIMDRAEVPKTCVLGRKDDRAAGVVYIALYEDAAMLHALAVAPKYRRMSLAREMIYEGARWAVEAGAERFEMITTLANDASNALAESFGMEVRAQYHYRRAPEVA
ncbi:GNAT family N-acetyltransferase [Thioclava sp. F1Mire-8]|uniref:GNAT family N-acetyltransferase n=1 Tax=Thioclava sp. F1Mire-8 TaxID=1973006 RepID=UPI000B53D0C1|nr:GNAT family N-acetyltransferase [Thioclava sp. F1Mire-8]OWY02544.1 GNAT family N-acetyltransferase [Thioclava sp. F1Mire-8]